MNHIGQFAFVSHHGRLLQAYTPDRNHGEMHASQEVNRMGNEERWNVYKWPDGKVSLQNVGSNRWLCADGGRAVCDRTNPDIFEKWTLHVIANRVAFLSHENRWLCAHPPGQDTSGGGEVIADRGRCDDWERFSMVPSAGIPDGSVNVWNTIQTVAAVATTVLPLLL